MKAKISLKVFSLLIVGLLLTNYSCSNRDETISCFPDQQINVQLNLNLPAYYNGLTNNGWIYINEQQSGSRGLILVKTSNGFKVYDRNAPHICPNTNTTLEVQGNIKIVCPHDGAEWIMLTGEPIKGSNLPPKTYGYSYNPTTRVINIYY